MDSENDCTVSSSNEALMTIHVDNWKKTDELQDEALSQKQRFCTSSAHETVHKTSRSKGGNNQDQYKLQR
jgi:hypothetical protein